MVKYGVTFRPTFFITQLNTISLNQNNSFCITIIKTLMTLQEDVSLFVQLENVLECHKSCYDNTPPTMAILCQSTPVKY